MRAKRVRRGSTLVMVGIMLVAFVGVGAIAADIGRFYVVTSEVQTAADAAAIEGARKLMKTPGATPEDTVDADVIAWVAATQRANMTALSTTADAVQMLFYTPGTNGNQGTLDPNLNGRRPNAVRVTLRSTPTGYFAQLLGQTGTRLLRRSGTAWVANIGSNCIRPWAFPYLALYKKVSGIAANPAPDLDMAQFTTFISQPTTSRMFTVVGQNKLALAPQPNSGEWTGFNFTGNNGKKDFEAGIQGCWNNKINPYDSTGKTLPGNSGNYAKWTTSAIKYSSGGPCAFNSATYTANCYASPSSPSPGVTINTSWADVVANGANGITFSRYVGEFQILCYYGSKTDKCQNNEPGTPNTGYPEGTIVGYMRALKSRVIDKDDVLGNRATGIQTIVLVQ